MYIPRVCIKSVYGHMCVLYIYCTELLLTVQYIQYIVHLVRMLEIFQRGNVLRVRSCKDNRTHGTTFSLPPVCPGWSQV